MNLLIADYALLTYMLSLLSVDEILLPRYMNWSTNFRGLSFNCENVLLEYQSYLLHAPGYSAEI